MSNYNELNSGVTNTTHLHTPKSYTINRRSHTLISRRKPLHLARRTERMIAGYTLDSRVRIERAIFALALFSVSHSIPGVNKKRELTQ